MILHTGGFYKHINGYTYVLLHVAIDEDGGRHVIHQGTHDGRVWTRTEENFRGLHASGSPRFKLETLIASS